MHTRCLLSKTIRAAVSFAFPPCSHSSCAIPNESTAHLSADCVTLQSFVLAQMSVQWKKRPFLLFPHFCCTFVICCTDGGKVINYLCPRCSQCKTFMALRLVPAAEVYYFTSGLAVVVFSSVKQALNLSREHSVH